MTAKQWADAWMAGQVGMFPIGRNAAVTTLLPHAYREPRPEECRQVAPRRKPTKPKEVT